VRSTLAVAGAIALLLAPAAAAGDVSGSEFQSLARRAAHDPHALATLRSVDSVDGRPVNLERALAGASGAELRLRLRALEARQQAAGPPPQARRHAERILSERRFQDEATPRPFRRLLEWLSAPVRAVVRALDRVVETLARPLPGGESTFWTLLALLVCAAAAVIAVRIARNRTGASVERLGRTGRAGRLDPRRLEREADEAERRGDFERALRLRFRAGLIRLGLAEAIPLRDSVTSGEVRRRLRQPEFDLLAATFDEVVYGGRRPERSDAEDARAGWPRVLKAVTAR
jgi:hypothetical protein